MSVWSDKYVKFKAVAQAQFGAFVSDATSGRLVPRMSGEYAAQTLAYWRDQSLLIARKYIRDTYGIHADAVLRMTPAQMAEFGVIAGFTNWYRAVLALQAYATAVTPQCITAGKAWITQSTTIKIWDTIGPVAVGMYAISSTPPDSFMDAYAETLLGYGKAAAEQTAAFVKSALSKAANAAGGLVSGILGNVLPPWLVPVALVAGGVWFYTKIRSRS